jgi:hypothetical protein
LLSDLRKLGFHKFSQDAWHWVELVNITCAFLSILFYALRSYMVVKAVEFMKNNKGLLLAC